MHIKSSALNTCLVCLLACLVKNYWSVFQTVSCLGKHGCFLCLTDVVLQVHLITARRAEIIRITEQMLSCIDEGDYNEYLLVKTAYVTCSINKVVHVVVIVIIIIIIIIIILFFFIIIII